MKNIAIFKRINCLTTFILVWSSCLEFAWSLFGVEFCVTHPTGGGNVHF